MAKKTVKKNRKPVAETPATEEVTAAETKVTDVEEDVEKDGHVEELVEEDIQERAEAVAADENACVNKASEETFDGQRRHGIEEKPGTLILRFFSKDDRTNKILTRLRRKVYFPSDSNLKPGWYIATIVEIKDSFGIMDTVELAAIPPHLWSPKHILGVFIKRDHANNCLEIYSAVPKAYLEELTPPCIFKVALPEPPYCAGATIGEIIKAKAEAAGQ